MAVGVERELVRGKGGGGRGRGEERRTDLNYSDLTRRAFRCSAFAERAKCGTNGECGIFGASHIESPCGKGEVKGGKGREGKGGRDGWAGGLGGSGDSGRAA
jgi:hypothetical protein